MSNTDGIVQMVVENRIDLGLVEGPVHNRSLAVRRYDVDKLVVALPPGHALAHELEDGLDNRIHSGVDRVR